MSVIVEVKSDADDLIDELRSLGHSLAGVYPWAFRLGAYVRESSPWRYLPFAEANPAQAELPLEQARDYAFLDWLEQSADLEWLDGALAGYLKAGPAYLFEELENTARWYRTLSSRP